MENNDLEILERVLGIVSLTLYDPADRNICEMAVRRAIVRLQRDQVLGTLGPDEKELKESMQKTLKYVQK